LIPSSLEMRRTRMAARKDVAAMPKLAQLVAFNSARKQRIIHKKALRWIGIPETQDGYSFIKTQYRHSSSAEY